MQSLATSVKYIKKQGGFSIPLGSCDDEGGKIRGVAAENVLAQNMYLQGSANNQVSKFREEFPGAGWKLNVERLPNGNPDTAKEHVLL